MTVTPDGAGPGRGLASRLRRRLAGFLDENGSLTQRAVASMLWLLSGAIVMKLLRLGSNLILVRLLTPEDFGLIALIFTLHTGFEMLTDLGIRQAVVRSPRGDEIGFLRTAWTVQAMKFGLGVLAMVGLGAFLGALAAQVDLTSSIYGHPDLPGLVAASGLVLAFNGLESMNIAIAERRVQARQVIQMGATAYVIGTAVTILLAWLNPTVWSLLWGSAFTAGLRCALSHVMLPGPRMALRLAPAERAEIWNFGKWLMGSSVLGFVARNGDVLILAALLDPRLFGFYAIARLWLDAGTQTVNRLSRRIGLAALSEVHRDRPHALPRVFRKYRLAQNGVCVALFLVFALLGQPLIALLYPTDFHSVGMLLPILAPRLLMQSYAALTSLVLAAGRSREVAAITLRQTLAVLVGIPAAYWLFGTEGALFVVAAGGAVGMPTLLRVAHGVVPFRMPLEYARLAGIVLIAVALVFAIDWRDA